MRTESVFIRLKNPIFRSVYNAKRKKKLHYNLYGTSSKQAQNNLNSRLNFLSFIKSTSDSIIPAFRKSINISSSIINYVFSSIKKQETTNNKTSESISEKTSSLDSNKTVCEQPVSSEIKHTSTGTAAAGHETEHNKSLVLKSKTEDASYLEQAFFDWLSGNTAREKRREFLEKNEKVSKSKKVVISKSSLQQRSRFLVQSLNEASSSGSQLLRLEEVCKHLLLYPNQKTEMCKAGLFKSVLHLKHYSKDLAVETQAKIVLSLIGYHEPPGGQGIRILSIDGGGTRGIMAIEVLRQLEVKTNKKIYELFDFMCGVSSGAILSLLLGALRLSLDECEHLYRKLSDEVFSQSAFWGTSRLVWSHAYYDTTMWVKVLKKIFGEKLLIESSTDKNSPKIAVISTVMNLPHLQPFVFRNYDFPPHVQSHYLGSCRYRMWESIRASGAAPGYFEEYCLDEYLHQDGGVIINNPAALGIHEARLLWPSEPIQCVVSLGSGRFIPSSQPTITSTSLKTKVLKIIDSATDTEGVHVALNDLLSPHTYFRINPYLTENLMLDENRTEKLDQMKRDAQMYLRRNEYKFNTCAMTLCIERGYLKKAIDFLRTQKDLYL